jgi:hypothetical protein
MIYAASGGNVTVAGTATITLSGTPAWASAGCAAGDCGTIFFIGGSAFSGSATGKRYNAVSNGVVDTQGGGASFIPGNSAGATATGGQYL